MQGVSLLNPASFQVRPSCISGSMQTYECLSKQRLPFQALDFLVAVAGCRSEPLLFVSYLHAVLLLVLLPLCCCLCPLTPLPPPHTRPHTHLHRLPQVPPCPGLDHGQPGPVNDGVQGRIHQVGG